jgi:hypothetical protein
MTGDLLPGTAEPESKGGIYDLFKVFVKNRPLYSCLAKLLKTIYNHNQ